MCAWLCVVHLPACLPQFEEVFDSDDVLMQLNAVDLLAPIASTADGARHMFTGGASAQRRPLPAALAVRCYRSSVTRSCCAHPCPRRRCGARTGVIEKLLHLAGVAGLDDEPGEPVPEPDAFVGDQALAAVCQMVKLAAGVGALDPLAVGVPDRRDAC